MERKLARLRREVAEVKGEFEQRGERQRMRLPQIHSMKPRAWIH